jgi:hypothetical protein
MKRPDALPGEDQLTEMLILPDGTIFVHNLTPLMARLLAELNPTDTAMLQRASLPGTLSIPPHAGPYDARFCDRN